MSFIDVKQVSKRYRVMKRTKGERTGTLTRERHEYVDALRNVSFNIERREIVGYIGPNGAGKSTTIKILSGILTPDSGSCVVDAEIPWANRKRYVRNIGVMFGQRSQLLWDLPPIDSFELIKGIYSIDERKYRSVLETLTDTLGLQRLLDTPVRQLSLGQRVRCELAATFIHSPKLVFLDEPTIGVDIEAKKAFHEFVKFINELWGVTIVIASHDLDDIESVCNRLMIINEGQLYYDNTIRQLYRDYPIRGKVFIEMARDHEVVLPAEATLVKREADSLTVEVSQSGDVGTVINDIASKNNIRSICVERPRIDDIILKIYRSFKEQ